MNDDGHILTFGVIFGGLILLVTSAIGGTLIVLSLQARGKKLDDQDRVNGNGEVKSTSGAD